MIIIFYNCGTYNMLLVYEANYRKGFLHGTQHFWRLPANKNEKLKYFSKVDKNDGLYSYKKWKKGRGKDLKEPFPTKLKYLKDWNNIK